MVDFLLMVIELFSLAVTVEAQWANIGRNCAVWKGDGSLWARSLGGRGSSTNEVCCQKTRVPGLSRGVVCVILCLAVLIQYRHETHRQTRDDGYYPRIARAVRVKKTKNTCKLAHFSISSASCKCITRRHVSTWRFIFIGWTCSKICVVIDECV